jgi:hypothetical protein
MRTEDVFFKLVLVSQGDALRLDDCRNVLTSAFRRSIRRPSSPEVFDPDTQWPRSAADEKLASMGLLAFIFA